jgi:competence protein ComEA
MHWRVQRILACWALMVLASMATHLAWQRWQAGGLVDVEKAPRAQPPTFFVDVNAAGIAELMLLPQIGETLASRIVDSREQEGPFGTLEELSRVRGIGPKTLEQIRPFVRVHRPPTSTSP